MGLGNDVADAHHIENGAHRAAGDNAGTFGGRMEHNAGSTVMAFNSVENGTVAKRYFFHGAASLVHCFLNGNRNFAGLAFAHTDASVAVTNYCQSSETENTAAFNNLGNTIDRNHFFANAVVLFLGNCVLGFFAI